MLHVWIHKLNRCGIHAGVDPEVSPGAVSEDAVPEVSVRELGEVFTLMGIPNPYMTHNGGGGHM
jgi:hypothetical protein